MSYKLSQVFHTSTLMIQLIFNDLLFPTYSGPTVKVRLIAGNRPPLSIGPLPILYRRQEKAQLNLQLDQLLTLFKDTGQKVYLFAQSVGLLCISRTCGSRRS